MTPTSTLGGIRIAAVGILFADLPVAAMNDEFAMLILSDAARLVDGITLALVDRSRTGIARTLYCPPAAVRNYMLIFTHGCLHLKLMRLLSRD